MQLSCQRATGDISGNLYVQQCCGDVHRGRLRNTDPQSRFCAQCQLPFAGEVPPVWVYRVFGTVGVYHDVAFEIAVDDFKGPATYRYPAASVTVGPIGTDLKTSQTFRSTTNATLVVNADQLSGNIEATLHAYPSYHGGNLSNASVHAQGAFICSRLKPAESP